MAFRMTRPTIQGTEYHKASVLKANAGTVAQTRTTADATLVSAASVLGQSNIPKVPDFTIKPAVINIPEGDGGEKKPREKKTKKTESENFNTYVEFMQSQRLDNQIMSEDDWRKLSRRKQKNLIEPKTERTSEQKTNDAIYNNAIEGGIVQKNMIESGYTPPHEEETVTGVANENGDAPGGEATEVAPTPKGDMYHFSGKPGDKYKYRAKYLAGKPERASDYEFQRPGSDVWEVAKPGEGREAIRELWNDSETPYGEDTPFFKKSPLEKGIGKYAKKAKGSRNYKMNK